MIALETALVAVLVAVSPKSEPPPCAAPDTVAPETCEVFFGSASKRHANRLSRKQKLRSVVARDHTIDITYSGTWQDPTPLRPKKMTVVGTYSAEQCTPVALVKLEQSTGECQAGTYALPPDVSLGPDAQVLAVVRDVVVIEHRGELAYIATQGSTVPVFRMAWLAPFTIKRASGSSGGSSSKANPGKPGRPATPAAKAAARRKKNK